MRKVPSISGYGEQQLFPAPTLGGSSTHCRSYREQQWHPAPHKAGPVCSYRPHKAGPVYSYRPHKAGPVYSYRNQLQFVCTLFLDLQWVLSE
jgi:hypothetical protein